MKNKFLKMFLGVFVVLAGCLFTLTACDSEKTFDVSTIKVKDVVVTYDGQAHAIEIEGEIPDWVKTSISYTLQDEEEVVAAPINAGIYNAVVSFKDENGKAVADDLTATLTINKADFGEVEISVSASSTIEGEDDPRTDSAKYDPDDDEFYFELDEDLLTRVINFPTFTIDGKTYSNNNGAVITFYKAIQDDETFSSDDVIIGAGTSLMACDVTAEGDNNPEDPDVVYIQYTISDENHNPLTDYAVVRVTRKTMEIKNYDDLLAMREQLTELTMDRQDGNLTEETWTEYANARKYRYVLRNDIDCGGATWQPIGRTYNMDRNSENEHYDCIFVGEFDGNGYTISNFKITNESFGDCLKAPNGIQAGFFGHIASAIIHDVNFDNETIDINTDNYTWAQKNPVYAGFVVGRIGSEHKGSDLYNIKITNSTLKIDAYKAEAGGIIGYETINPNETAIRRENLDLENVQIFVINKSNENQKIVVGGIVADSVAATQHDNQIVYKDCDLKNVKLGFDYDGYTEATDNKDNFVTKSEYTEYVAAFCAYVRSEIKFENCTITNYLLATNDTTYGYYATIVENGHVFIENCSETNEEGWNDNVSGVYSTTGATNEIPWTGKED